ncbi:MAG: AIM24 family protein, partial [Myxococcaceae bacterium]|nr:AIM24 family protein [Myxococcaceae bacterium]
AAPADPAQASWGEQAAPADPAQASWGEQAAPADPAQASWGEQAAPADPAQASWGEQAAQPAEPAAESWNDQQSQQWSADAAAPAATAEGEYSVPGYGATGGYDAGDGQGGAAAMPEHPPANEQDFSMVVPGEGGQGAEAPQAFAVDPGAPRAEASAPAGDEVQAQPVPSEAGYAPAAYDPAAFEETVPPVNAAHAPEYATTEAVPGAGAALPSWLSQGQAATEPPPADPYAASLSNTAGARAAEAPAGYSSLSVPRLADLGPQLDTSAVPTTGPFHVGKDGLAVTVAGEMLMRLDGVVAVVGTIDAVPERRKMRGRPVEQNFGDGPSQMQRVKGHGVLHLEVGKGNFQAIELADEGAYLREERVFAFEESVSFENGRLTADGLALDLVHLKGQGRVLLKLEAGLKAMALPPGAPLKVPLARLVGWYGHVTPRLMGFVGQGAVELTGDGYALLASG